MHRMGIALIVMACLLTFIALIFLLYLIITIVRRVEGHERHSNVPHVKFDNEPKRITKEVGYRDDDDDEK